MNFYIGQEIVCVDGKDGWVNEALEKSGATARYVVLIEGQQYKVRGISEEGGLYLEGIHNPIVRYQTKTGIVTMEVPYRSTRFVPLDTFLSEISIEELIKEPQEV